MVSSEAAIKKIYQYPDTYIIFFTYECPYCQKALAILKESDVPYKGYNLNDIDGGQQSFLKQLNYQKMLDDYNKSHNVVHQTRPFIFYNQQFIGGLSDLQLLLN